MTKQLSQLVAVIVSSVAVVGFVGVTLNSPQVKTQLAEFALDTEIENVVVLSDRY